MRWYHALSLVGSVAAAAYVAGIRVSHWGTAPPDSRIAVPCATCCSPAAASASSRAKPPAIPTGSDLPCLVEFGSEKSVDCKQMAQVVDEVETRLKGKVDVVRVDADLHLGEVQRWRLRMVPTQILTDAQGKELWRHEGYIATERLLAEVHNAVPGDK